MVLGKEIKRVALINPFQVTSEGYDNEVILRKGQSTELPLGLAYLSAYLKRYGYEVKIFDAHMAAIKGIALGRFSRMEEAEDELLDSVRDFRPDLVGITCPFHYIYKTAHRIAGRITGCPVVMGGAYPTVSPEIALLDENIDFVVMGEGERTFLGLFEALNGRCDFSKLVGIGYRKNGFPVIQRGFDLLPSLDDIPLPDRSDLIIEDYYLYGRHFIQRFEEYEGRELKIATLTATRGCVFNCSFCINRKMWSRGLRMRSPESVLAEIEFLKREHGIGYFAFNDDNLLINKLFAQKLLRGLSKLDIRWTTGGMSVRGLDEEMVSLALESGCLIFNLAIESASEETLKGIRKPVRPEEARRVAQIVKDKGGYLMGLFMLGFPEETEEQFRETIRFGKSLECDWTLYSCVTPFPGSELYDEAKAKGMLPEEVEHDFERLNFRNYVLRPRYLAPEFVEREAYFANLDQNFFENPNLRSGRTAIALSDFQNVVKLVPTHASVYYCIGRIHEERGHLDLAGHFYDLARQHLSGIHQEYFARASIIIP